MAWMEYCVLILFVTRCLCQPLNNRNSSEGEQGKEKKGTIRIAGPWHSDSALDRNVDIGEDSYVKKIISSNEGINFNKDIAEAGEMFDVNGIDDFYDKNAMITYEINGHEIPVHLKPKLTPQSKSLFPEYVKDSPSEMTGFVRGHKGGNIHGYSKKVAGLRFMPGLSLNDLPEYKTSEFAAGKTSRPNPWKSLDGLKDDQTLSNALKQNRLLTKLVGKQMPVMSEFHHHRHHHHERNPENNREQEDFNYNPITDESLKHHVPRLQQQKPQENVLHKFMDNRPSKETALFQNIDSLHQKLQKDKEVHEAELRSISSQNMDPQKEKAKTRILNLLGELTDKLKGMENIVSAHRDKEVERFISNRGHDIENAVDEGKVNKNIGDSIESSHHQSKFVEARDRAGGDSKVEAMETIGQQFKERVAELQHGLDEGAKEKPAELGYQGRESAKDESPQHGDDDLKNKELLLKSFQRIGSLSRQDLPHHAIEGERKEGDLVEKFRDDDNKPIIMNTEAIDYKPTKDDSDDNDDDSNKVDRVNSDGEEEMSQTLKKKNPSKFIESDNNDGDVDKDDRLPERRKHDKDSERSSSRHMLLKYHHKKSSHEDDYDNDDDDDGSDDDEKKHFLSEEDGDNDDEEEEENTAHRHKAARRRHPKDDNDDDDDDADVVKSIHHQRHHRKHHHRYDDDKEIESASLKNHKDEDLSGEEHAKSFDSKKEIDDDGVEEKENSKMFEVEESLGEADEKNSIARRHRSFRPKAQDDNNMQYPDYNEVKDAAIFETNLQRKRFHANSIHWSDRLSDKAQKIAETLAEKTDLSERTISKFKEPGHNIALVDINTPNVGKEAPDIWASEARFYDFRSPQMTSKNMDFAQMMWKSDNEFGLGVAKSKIGNKWVVISAYDSPVIDRFKDLKLNVESDIPISDPYSDITGR